MIKMIPVSDLQLGMYVHKLDVFWIKHQRLNNGFLLTKPEELAEIIQNGNKQVWIDLNKGEDLAVKIDDGEQQTHRIHFSDNHQSVLASEIDNARLICQSAKPMIIEMFNQVRLGNAIELESTLPLIDDINRSVQRHPTALLSVVRLKNHDDYTYLHSVAVCALMMTLARQIGMDEHEIRMAGMGGLMHDMGKAAVSADIINKPGKLTDEEFDVMRSHPLAGQQILAACGAPFEAQDIALHHHEKINGRGYPNGLKGDEISLLARMSAICDVYDAITSNRAYKEGWDPADAMRQMASWEGHFDKKLFYAFVKSVGIYPVGSLVNLASGRVAVVTESTPDSLLQPKVKVFFSLLTHTPIRKKIINLAAPHCDDSIVAIADHSQWRDMDLNEMWL